MSRGRAITMAIPGVLVTTALLFALWLVLSDQRDVFHVGVGLGSSALVAIYNNRLLAIGRRRTRRGGVAVCYVFSFRWWRLLVLLPWALWQVLVANLQVARMIVHPRMPIDPAIIRVSTGLRGQLARAAAAALITLMPGTCVLDVQGDELVIHSIHPVSAESIETGLVDMVRWTFEMELIDA